MSVPARLHTETSRIHRSHQHSIRNAYYFSMFGDLLVSMSRGRHSPLKLSI